MQPDWLPTLPLQVLRQPLDLAPERLPLGEEGPNHLGSAARAKVLDLVVEDVSIADGFAQDRVEPPVSLLEAGEKVAVELVNLATTNDRFGGNALHGWAPPSVAIPWLAPERVQWIASSVPNARSRNRALLCKLRRQADLLQASAIRLMAPLARLVKGEVPQAPSGWDSRCRHSATSRGMSARAAKDPIDLKGSFAASILLGRSLYRGISSHPSSEPPSGARGRSELREVDEQGCVVAQRAAPPTARRGPPQVGGLLQVREQGGVDEGLVDAEAVPA